MVRFKIIFKDGDAKKRIFGDAEFEGPLVKVISDQGNIVYINKASIVFMKELRRECFDH